MNAPQRRAPSGSVTGKFPRMPIRKTLPGCASAAYDAARTQRPKVPRNVRRFIIGSALRQAVWGSGVNGGRLVTASMAAPILSEDQRVPPSDDPVPKPLQRTRAQPSVSRPASCWSGCGSQRNGFGVSLSPSVRPAGIDPPPDLRWALIVALGGLDRMSLEEGLILQDGLQRSTEGANSGNGLNRLGRGARRSHIRISVRGTNSRVTRRPGRVNQARGSAGTAENLPDKLARGHEVADHAHERAEQRRTAREEDRKS